jgi:hypothetical protein
MLTRLSWTPPAVLCFSARAYSKSQLDLQRGASARVGKVACNLALACAQIEGRIAHLPAVSGSESPKFDRPVTTRKLMNYHKES